MAKKWSEVESSKEYQALSADEKEAARNQYFEQVVAPQIPEGERAAAKTQFDTATAPKKAAKETTFLEDVGKFAKGVGRTALAAPSILKGVGGAIAKPVTEPIAKLATGAVAKPVSEIAGLAATGYEAATGGETAGEVPGFQKAVQERLTYEPTSEAAKSAINPLTGLPMLIGKGIEAVTPEKAAPGESLTLKGALRNIAAEAVPQAIGLAGAKYAPMAEAPTIKASKKLRTTAEHLMQSALKPTPKDLLSGDAAAAIDTMLEKGISATPKGIEKVRARIDELNDQIKEAIANSPERVETAKLAKPVVQKLREFRKQVNPDADMAAIRKSWNEFKSHPSLQHRTPEQVIPEKVDPYTGVTTPERVIPATGKEDMPVQTAQELKTGTYRQLAKKYGQMGSADVEAQKAIARGLKEEVAGKVPEVVPLNLEESKLLNVLDVAERRIVMEANKNPMGLAALRIDDPKAWAAFMADRSASAKSLIARILNRASKKVGKAAKGRVGERAVTLESALAPSEVGRERENQTPLSEGFGR